MQAVGVHVIEIMAGYGNLCVVFFFFKQKTAYEMCGRDWSSDVCSSDLIVFMADIGSVRKVDFIHRRVDTYRLVPNLEDMSINGGFVYTLRSGPSGQEITIFSQNTTIAMHTCPSDAPCAEKGVFHKFSAVSPEILLGIPYGGKSLVLWNLETNAKRPLCEPGVCSVKYLMDMSAVGTTIYIGSVWQAKDGGGLYDVTFTGI